MFFVVEGGAKGCLAHIFCDGGGGQRAGWRMFFVVWVRVTITVKIRVRPKLSGWHVRVKWF